MEQSMDERVLIIDDEESTAIALRDGLRRFDLRTDASFEPEDALARLRSRAADVVLLDLCLPNANGIDVCRRLAEQHPGTLVIVMSARGSLGSAVAAVKAGAHDFITKPFELASIARQIRSALDQKGRAADSAPATALVDTAAFPALDGSSPAITRVRRLLSRVAASDASVLLCGESGTGKELVTRGLHDRSRRSDRPFVAINCAGLPEPLLESELFGHVRGAFTDARSDREGLFLQARGGTLFLDEIGELPPALQPKLLRVLEERRVRPVGSNQEIPLDVRVMAATNRALEAEARSGRFRLDLFYRLDVLRVSLPPLRERGEDILLLARRFAGRAAAQEGRPVPALAPEVARLLLQHRWPGNVRELRNCMEHAVALSCGDRIEVDDLPDAVRGAETAGIPIAADWLTLEEVERRYVGSVLDHTRGNRSSAARILGIDRRTLMRKLSGYRGA
jgi:DNA-binding NtrC family response regulator